MHKDQERGEILKQSGYEVWIKVREEGGYFEDFPISSPSEWLQQNFQL